MPNYSQHLVAFIDILGFRKAMSDRNRADSILASLGKLAAFQGNFYAESKKNKHGHQSFVRPAISAFSDNIVISYPLDRLAEHGLDVGMVVIFLQTLVGFIAWNAGSRRCRDGRRLPFGRRGLWSCAH